MDTSGPLSEGEFALECLRRGAVPHFPFGGAQPEHDLLVSLADGRVVRVQVKGGYSISRADSASPRVMFPGPKAKNRTYDNIDFFVLHVGVNGIDDWYIIPASEKGDAKSIAVPLNSQNNGSQWARYLNAWHLLLGDTERPLGRSPRPDSVRSRERAT